MAGGIAVRPKVHYNKERQHVGSMIIIKASGPIFFLTLDLGLTYLPHGNLPSLTDQFMNNGCRLCSRPTVKGLAR